MLIIKTRLDKSLISGIGVFADQDVMKGDIVWRLSKLSVFKISRKDYEELSEQDKRFIHEKDYYWIDDDDSYMIPMDDSRFINHSESPNIIDKDSTTCIASRDIRSGEELTMNYRELCPEYDWKPYFM